MRLFHLGFVALALLPAISPPALAEDVAPATDRLLWCSSAFYWLAGNAFDSGATAEAAQYEKWSGALMEAGIAALRSAGRSDEEIETLVEGYDARVLDQIGVPGAPYEVTACPELVHKDTPADP
jgi:hypothetical protein